MPNHIRCSIRTTLRLVVTLLILLLSSNKAYGFRSTIKLQYRPELNWGISLLTEADFRSVGFNNDYRHFDAGFRIPLKFLGEGWDTEFRMRAAFRRSRDSTGWDLERRPHATINKGFNTKEYKSIPSLKLKIRGRYEYRLRANGDDSARIRLKFSAESSKKFYNLTPLVANEVYYDFDQSRLVGNRIDFGLKIPQYQKLKSSILYRIDSDINRGSNLEHFHALVLTFRF